MSENRYGQQRKNYTNVNEPGPHYTSSTYKGSGRNRRRQSQRVRRRRKRRNLMLVLLTVVCFTSMVFALQLPQRIYSIYEMVTQASGSGENQDGDINGKGKLFGEAAGVGSGAGLNGDGGGENGTDHVGSGSDSTLAAGSDARSGFPGPDRWKKYRNWQSYKSGRAVQPQCHSCFIGFWGGFSRKK